MNLVFRQTAMTGILGLVDKRNRFGLAHDHHLDLVGLVGGSLDSLMDRNAAAALSSMGVAEVAVSKNRTEKAREGETGREREQERERVDEREKERRNKEREKENGTERGRKRN